jgi:hypothetical protein
MVWVNKCRGKSVEFSTPLMGGQRVKPNGNQKTATKKFVAIPFYGQKI